MKLREENYRTRGSAAIRENVFEIGDGAHIIKLLRESLYSNPILAICREIASNCRDAHREVGTPERPIRISLPNSLDDNIQFQDWGPGISPSRMEDVYTKFGNSTKRSDNTETGGFGLGAKTPFAYTASFIVETVSKIECQSDVDLINQANETNLTLDEVRGQNLKCGYIASLGGDNGDNGGVKLFSVDITDEETGTIVAIGVQPDDRRKFVDAVRTSTKHWDVKPIIDGFPGFEYGESPRTVVSGDGWRITIRNNGYYASQYAIVDGIEYPLDLSHVREAMSKGEDKDFVAALMRTTLFLSFNTGDLSLTPNREELHYNRHTVDVIKKVVSNIQDTIYDTLVSKVSACSTYREASVNLQEFNQNVVDVGRPVYWNGNRVYTRYINFFSALYKGDKKYDSNRVARLDSFEFRRGRGEYGSSRRWFRSSKGTQVDINAPLLIHDGKKSVPKSSVEGFQQHKDRDEHDTFNLLVATDGDVDGLRERIKKELELDLDQIGCLNLSNYAQPKTKKTHTRGYSNAWIFNNTDFEPEKIDRKDGEGVYISLMDRKQTIRTKTGGRFINTRTLSRIVEALGIKEEIYGIRDDVISRLGDGWVSLQTLIDQETERLLEKYPEEKQRELHAAATINTDCDIVKTIKRNRVECKEMNEWDALTADIKTLREEYNKVSTLFEVFGLKFATCKEDDNKVRQHQLTLLKERIEKKYPLLEFANGYSYDADRKRREAMQGYVEAMDILEESEKYMTVKEAV